MLSVISCVSGRVKMFARALEALAKQDGASEVQYCLAIWGDDLPHRHIVDLLGHHFADVRVTTVSTRDHWPLPRAYNAALALSGIDKYHIMILGAEVVLPPGTVRWAMDVRSAGGDVAWLTGCIDEASGRQRVGQKWKGAFPYCMVLPWVPLFNVGGWDEVMGKGIAFDDPDLTIRLLMDGVTFRWNFDLMAVHQSHTKVDNEGLEKTRERWKAINEAEFKRRLGDIPVTEIWPCWWPDGSRHEFPEDDGIEIQDALRQRLLKSDYPRRAVETAIC